jgi:hypothetical protein
MSEIVLPKKQLLVLVNETKDNRYIWKIIQANCALEQSDKSYDCFEEAYKAGQQMAHLVIPIFPIAEPNLNSISYGYMVSDF